MKTEEILKIQDHLSDEQLRYIFVEIHDGRGYHGSFLVAFAKTLLAADEQNFALLADDAQSLVGKYSLATYLDNYGNEGGE